MNLIAMTAVLAAAQAQVSAIKASDAKLFAAKSLSGTMQVTFPGAQKQDWKFRFLKPNYYEIIAPDQQYRSDGKTEWQYFPDSKKFEALDRKGGQITDAPFALGLNAFFTGDPGGAVKAEQPATLDGKGAVAVSLLQPGFVAATTLYLGKASGLPLGYDQSMDSSALVVRFSDLKLDAPMTPQSFAWSPPAGASQDTLPDLGSRLLKPGDSAPALGLKDLGGAPLNLADEFKTHRATLLYFWPGQPPIPDAKSLSDLYGELKLQRLEIVAIASSALADAAGTLKAQALPFPAVIDAEGSVAKAFGIQAQTEYLVGNDGKVIAHYLGHDPDALARSLRQIGFHI